MIWTWTLLACAPKPAPPAPVEAPRLPAPTAPLYARDPAVPGDPELAKLVSGLLWDETLSGAAGALAMTMLGSRPDDPPLDGSEARWAAYRAGWPYPLDVLATATTTPGESPRGLLDPVFSHPPQALGLARARGSSADAWVLLTGTVPLAVAPFPREWSRGSTFTVQVPSTSGWTDLALRAVSPSGRLVEGVPIVLDQRGEWLVELAGTHRGHRELVFSAPVYVDETTPADGPFALRIPPPGSAAEALEQLDSSLAELRSLRGSPGPEPDPALTAAAEHALADGGGPGAIAARLSRVGYPPTSAAAFRCTGRTVHACLDHLFWSLDSRGDLLDPGLAAYGAAARIDGQAVAILLALATP